MSNPQPAIWARATNTTWKKTAIAVGMLALIIFVPYGIAEFNYQQRIDTLKHEIKQIEQDALKPPTAVSTGPIGVRCSHFLDTVGWANGPCPQVGRDYLVLSSSDTQDD